MPESAALLVQCWRKRSPASCMSTLFAICWPFLFWKLYRCFPATLGPERRGPWGCLSSSSACLRARTTGSWHLRPATHLRKRGAS